MIVPGLPPVGFTIQRDKVEIFCRDKRDKKGKIVGETCVKVPEGASVDPLTGKFTMPEKTKPDMKCGSGKGSVVIEVDPKGPNRTQFECTGNVGAKGGVTMPCKRVKPAEKPKQHTVVVDPNTPVYIRNNGNAWKVTVVESPEGYKLDWSPVTSAGFGTPFGRGRFGHFNGFGRHGRFGR